MATAPASIETLAKMTIPSVMTVVMMAATRIGKFSMPAGLHRTHTFGVPAPTFRNVGPAGE
jgi:hypothetical protein